MIGLIVLYEHCVYVNSPSCHVIRGTGHGIRYFYFSREKLLSNKCGRVFTNVVLVIQRI